MWPNPLNECRYLLRRNNSLFSRLKRVLKKLSGFPFGYFKKLLFFRPEKTWLFRLVRSWPQLPRENKEILIKFRTKELWRSTSTSTYEKSLFFPASFFESLFITVTHNSPQTSFQCLEQRDILLQGHSEFTIQNSFLLLSDVVACLKDTPQRSLPHSILTLV